jgi:hypothetical protein
VKLPALNYLKRKSTEHGKEYSAEICPDLKELIATKTY